MTFDDLLAQVQALLQREQRLSYRALQRRFALEEADLEALKDELIYAKHLAMDEDDRVLVWVDDAGTTPAPASQALQSTATQADSQTAPPPPHGLSAGTPPPPEAERRQLTILFCDLVASTALSRQLDPEDYRAAVRAYQAACTPVIERFDGHIAQYLGDGLLVYFGYTLAHEDDAQRAVRAGMAMIEAIGALATRLEQQQGVRLAVRVGIHTGPVVVGEMGEGSRREQLALGETPNVAARLESLAAPNTVVISAALHQLVQGYFVCDDLGAPALKGVDTPFQVYHVLGESGAQSRLDVPSPRGLTPLVGREAEVTLLLDRWAQVTDGLGQVVLLSGEAGIGKSRLVQVLKNRLAGEPYMLLECRCSSYHTNSALYPKTLPVEVVQQLVTRGDGVPLFVEEMTKLVLASGLLREHEDHYALTGPLPPLAIPATLQDALMARLDQLASAKAVAQLGATIGREFTYELLRAVAPMDELELWRGLVQLVQAEVLYQRGALPQATYLFKHALIQEAAYQSLLKSTRQHYHQRIAEVLTSQLPATGETQPEVVAHHYTEAGLNAYALGYWQQAGDKAARRSAHVEAIAHFSKGLAVLKTLPDTSERALQELTLQRMLGVSLLSTKGFAAPEVEAVYARARELCQQVGDTAHLGPVLFGLWGFYKVRGDSQTARELAEQLLTLGQRQDDPALRLQGHRALGDTLFSVGEFVPGLTHVEQGIALYDAQQHRAHAFLYGQDPGAGCLSYAAMALWVLGYPDQARQRSHASLTLAHGLAHPFSLAHTLWFAVTVHGWCREWDVAQAHAEALLALATEQGFAQYVARGTYGRGWTLAMQGQVEEGIAQFHQGLAALRATGVGQVTANLAMLAQVYGQGGHIAEGLAALAEARAAVVKTADGRHWEGEIYRLTGDLFLRQAAPDEHQAETYFHQALDIARRRQARSWELRAAMSLSRLWQRQGKRTEACELLAPIYGWFTEGFDTADLQDATTLLEELGG